MYRGIKRGADIVISLAGIVILFPLLLVTGLMVFLDSGRPVLFRQKRVGRNKSYFVIYKFRTMCQDAPAELAAHLLTDRDRYLTRVGKVLRRTSLDELPQLFNILKGDMSIVGPRPALWNQFDLIEQRDLCGANQIRPGLTGWAQIQSRTELPIPVKAAYDGYYVAHEGFWLDLKCILITALVFLRGKGLAE